MREVRTASARCGEAALASLTSAERGQVRTLLRSLQRARMRAARLHARIRETEASACQVGAGQQKRAERRRMALTAARAEGEQNLRKIMQRIEAYGLRIPAIAGDIVVVDADDDKNAVTSARASAELARGDRAKESGKRHKQLTAAFDEERAAQRRAAKGKRFNKGDVYRAVAKAHRVSIATVRRARSP